MIRFVLLLLCLQTLPCFANLKYMHKFNQYQYWNTHMPAYAQADLLAFIQEKGLLNQRLREKWLLYLGEKQNWPLIAKYYQGSNSVSLQCYAATAYWHDHQDKKAMQIATPLWLSGHSQPKACNQIFHILALQNNWRKIYWAKRIKLALDERELLLARQLLQRGSLADKKAADDFWRLQTMPESITRLKPGPWYGEEHLYALKRMMLLNRSLNKIQLYYQKALNHKALTEDQNQRFVSFMALYLAMRNDAHHSYWFNKVRKNYYNQALLEWEMRYALLHQNWLKVKSMIQLMPKPLQPEQNYWLARAEKALHQTEAANARFAMLAQQRHYYGFLAALERHQQPNFQEKPSCHNYALLHDYQSLLNDVKTAYQQKAIGRAAQLLNDFMIELPKNEQCSLVDWVSKQLNWPTEAIILSNQPQLFDQIDVRFPTHYAGSIQANAKNNHLDSAFVFAIVRQESAFHPQIISPVGARGLMQMMPRTARLISNRYKMAYRKEQDLFNPHKNIQLGTRYLSDLNRHLNHPLLVAAAYNAGPQAVHKWLKQYPAPDIITWIDTLPWKETRNYIKNIVAFNAIYQHRLKQQVNLKQMLKPLPKKA